MEVDCMSKLVHNNASCNVFRRLIDSGREDDSGDAVLGGARIQRVWHTVCKVPAALR